MHGRLIIGGPGTLGSPGQLDDGMGLDGADPDGADSGSGDVYIGPEIYDDQDAVVICVPPCNFILPPISLESDTTITFPPYTTSLEVAWPTTSVVTLEDGSVSTSAGLGRTIQTTTLTIPPITTSMINVWNWPVPEDDDSNDHIEVMSSILPPPFIITEHPPHMAGNPSQTPGTKLPPGATTTSGSPGGIIPGITDPTPDTNSPPRTTEPDDSHSPGNSESPGMTDQTSDTNSPRRTTKPDDSQSPGNSESPGATDQPSHTNSPPRSTEPNDSQSPSSSGPPGTTDQTSDTNSPPRTTEPHDSQPPSSNESPGTTDPPSSSNSGTTRTITPPPFPYSRSDKPDTTPPVISRSVGPPGPLCTANCGPPCKVFCDDPCLLDYGNRNDFLSPLENQGEGNDKPKNTRKCRGPDCKNGKCTGPKCVTFNCEGPDCLDGICLGEDCSVTTCGGEDCDSSGCLGSHCGYDNRCVGPDCIGFGCTGPDCSDGTCQGFDCTPVVCEGTGCHEGYCEGPDCEEDGDCDEPQRVPHCTESVSEIKTDPKVTSYSITTRTECATVTACSAEATTITTTTTIDQEHAVTITESYELPPTHSIDWYRSNVDKLIDLRESRNAERFGATTTTTTSETPRSSPTGATGDDDISCFWHFAKTSAQRHILIDYVGRFCKNYEGVTLDAADPDGEHSIEDDYLDDCVFGCRYKTLISVKVINDCVFTFKGHSASSACGSSLRVPIDHCDTDGTYFKYGGNVTTECAVWTVGPPMDSS